VFLLRLRSYLKIPEWVQFSENDLLNHWNVGAKTGFIAS